MNKTSLTTGAYSDAGENLSRIMIANDWQVIGDTRRLRKLNHIREIIDSKSI